jgi:hypothetical protein
MRDIYIRGLPNHNPRIKNAFWTDVCLKLIFLFQRSQTYTAGVETASLLNTGTNQSGLLKIDVQSSRHSARWYIVDTFLVVLRIRYPRLFWPLDPRSGSGMKKKPDPGRTSQIFFPRAEKQLLGLKILIFSDADPDPGSGGINIPDPQHWFLV